MKMSTVKSDYSKINSGAGIVASGEILLANIRKARETTGLVEDVIIHIARKKGVVITEIHPDKSAGEKKTRRHFSADDAAHKGTVESLTRAVKAGYVRNCEKNGITSLADHKAHIAAFKAAQKDTPNLALTPYLDEIESLAKDYAYLNRVLGQLKASYKIKKHTARKNLNAFDTVKVEIAPQANPVQLSASGTNNAPAKTKAPKSVSQEPETGASVLEQFGTVDLKAGLDQFMKIHGVSKVIEIAGELAAEKAKRTRKPRRKTTGKK